MEGAFTVIDCLAPTQMKLERKKKARKKKNLFYVIYNVYKICFVDCQPNFIFQKYI